MRFAEFEVNFAQQELRKAGVRVRLQHKPFQILELLLERPGELVSRQELAHSLWPGLHVSFERGLNTAVNVLRQTLGDSPQECRFIETRSGLGYRFIGNLEEVLNPPEANLSHTLHEDCLKGRYFLNKLTDECSWKAIAHFESALAQDARYAAAHAGLADAYCQSVLQASISAASCAHKARDSASAALRHDAGLPEAHVACARVKMLFDWDWESAAVAFRKAVELGPYNAEAHRGYAAFLAATGRPTQALSESVQALRLNPLSCPTNTEYAWHLYLAGDSQGAVEQCWKVLTLEPAFSPAQQILGLAYQQLGMQEEALVELQNAVELSGHHPAAVGTLGHLYATAGLHVEALAMLQELDRRAHHRIVSPYWYTLIHAGLGDTVSAMERLEAARHQRDPALLWANVDPRLSTVSVICW